MSESEVVSRIWIIGAGDHGRVVADLARACGLEIAGFVEPSSNGREIGSVIDGIPVIGTLDDPADWARTGDQFVVAMGNNRARASAFHAAVALGIQPVTLVHPSAVVLSGAVLGGGSQVLAGAVIGLAASIGTNVIVNTSATVDHDCRVDAHAFIAPSATLAGKVFVGEGAHIGVGATVREMTAIGPWSLVAAGAVVVKDVTAGDRVAGVPASAMASSPDRHRSADSIEAANS